MDSVVDSVVDPSAHPCPVRVHVRAAGGVVAADSGLVRSDGFGAAPLMADAQPVPLRADAAAAAPQVSRMASRLAQLAVLGVADCMKQIKRGPDPATRIYLGTGLGDIAHTDALYYCVMPPRSEAPPPARFATSGNNLAAYFVARHTGITARNLTISASELSFERALELALADLAAGAAPAALVGGVDECTLPRDFYTRRFDVRLDQVIGEGSGWLLLDTLGVDDGTRASGAILEARVLSGRSRTEPSALAAELQCVARSLTRTDAKTAIALLGGNGIALLGGTGIAGDELIALQSALRRDWPDCGICDYLDWTGRFPTAAAPAIVAMFGALRERHPEGIAGLHVNRGPTESVGIVAFEVYPSA